MTKRAREIMQEDEEENYDAYVAMGEVRFEMTRNQPHTKEKRVPSVLVDCRDCSTTFEVDSRSFDLAVERGGVFVCDECRIELEDE